jgi:hypothetical protein
MSTTTNFKRIALVAVAALGLGVLSSVPTQAASMADSLTVSQVSAAQTTAETVTATVTTVTFAFTATDTTTDSMKLTASLTSGPAGGGLPYLAVVETTNAGVRANSGAGSTLAAGATINPGQFAFESATAVAANSVVSAKYNLYIGSSATGAPALAGTYVVSLTPAVVGGGGTLASTAKTVTIVVTDAAALDTKASATTSTAYMYKGAYDNNLSSADSVVAVAKTASTTAAATVFATLKNAAGVASVVSESITATVSGAGVIGIATSAGNAASGTVGATGRSMLFKKGEYVLVFPDGTAGKGTLTLTSAAGAAIGSAKTITFTDVTASFTDGKAVLPVVGTSAAVAVSFLAKDSAGNVQGAKPSTETYYAFSSDETILTTGTVAYSNDSGTVTVTGVKAGSATVTIGNASTLAASTIKSAPITVRVGTTAISSVKVSFDKATYAPGELATITVSLLDANGTAVIPGTYQTWAAGYELATDRTFNQGSITADTITTTSASTLVKTYTVYMPISNGKVTVSGVLAKTGDTTYPPKSGTTLVTAAAVQGTTVSASATVTDSGSAALAAVTALATTVASLRTLIVTLTNLVLKIQKKVKA